jgi:hypothetical protein
MRIYTLWSEVDVEEAGDCPYIVDAVDEYTIEAHGDFPPQYREKRGMPQNRELIIDVPEHAIRALFTSHMVIAEVVKG